MATATKTKSKSNTNTKTKSQAKSSSTKTSASKKKSSAGKVKAQSKKLNSAVKNASKKSTQAKTTKPKTKASASKAKSTSASKPKASASKGKSSSASKPKTQAKKRTTTKRASASKPKTQAQKRTATNRASASKPKTQAKKRTTTKRASASKPKTQAKTQTQQAAQSSQQKWPEPIQQSNSMDLIPSLALEEFDPHVETPVGIEDTTNGSTKFAWIGAGQCGGRLVKTFHELGYRKCLALNTAYHDLNSLNLPENQKILMDIGRKGAGKDISRGRDAAVQYRQDVIHAIQQLFASNVDHVMMAIGSGGGTGSGSALPLIETVRSTAKYLGLRDSNRRIGVLATLPTDGEAASPKVAHNAYEVMTELCQMAQEGEISPLIIIDNEKISRMYPGLTVKNFWPMINSTVGGLFDIFNRLSALSSPYTSFDSVDYQSICQAGGCAIMGLTKVKDFSTASAISDAMKASLSKTLLASGFDMRTAKVVGAIVVGGKNIMANTPGLQDNINNAFDVLTDLTGNATVHRGIYEDDKESLRVYTIIGGLDTPFDRLEELRRVS